MPSDSTLDPRRMRRGATVTLVFAIGFTVRQNRLRKRAAVLERGAAPAA
jgi:hypothetical protein